MLAMATKINDAVYGALEALDSFAPGEFLTITRLSPEVGETTLPAGTVRRVLVELIREVKRNTPVGALLEIVTSRTSLSRDETWPGINPGNYVAVSITIRAAGDVSPRLDLIKMLTIAQSGGAHLTVTAPTCAVTTLRVLMPQDGHTGLQPHRSEGEKTIFLAGEDLKHRARFRRLLLDQSYTVLEPGNHRCVDAVFTILGRRIDLVLLHLGSDTENNALPAWLPSSPGIPIVLCRPAWGNPLSGEAFLRRVRMLLSKPLPRQSVMIVDEDDSMRRMLAAVIETAGYEVCEARDGREALRSIAKQKPDAVLTEVVLPGTDGLQLIQALRKSEPDIRIIAVSGSPRADTYLWVARSLGADIAMHKPLWVEDLLQKIRNLLKGSLPQHLHYLNGDY
jgi:CheY-like chemotaxis protein